MSETALERDPRPAGLTVRTSDVDAAVTLDRFITALEDRGVPVLAVIDHAAAARDAGLELQSETVVVFGNARVGTPLMRIDPLIGIDLPLRVLIWDDGDAAFIAYRDPHTLVGSSLQAELAPQLAVMEKLLRETAAEAAGDSSGSSLQ